MRTYLVFVPGALAIIVALVVRGQLGLVLAGVGVAWCLATAFFMRQSGLL